MKTLKESKAKNTAIIVANRIVAECDADKVLSQNTVYYKYTFFFRKSARFFCIFFIFFNIFFTPFAPNKRFLDLKFHSPTIRLIFHYGKARQI